MQIFQTTCWLYKTREINDDRSAKLQCDHRPVFGTTCRWSHCKFAIATSPNSYFSSFEFFLHKIYMGAQEPHPEVGYGGCKIPYQMFEILNIFKVYFFHWCRNIVFLSTLDFFVNLDFQVLPLTSKKLFWRPFGHLTFLFFSKAKSPKCVWLIWEK